MEESRSLSALNSAWQVWTVGNEELLAVSVLFVFSGWVKLSGFYFRKNNFTVFTGWNKWERKENRRPLLYPVQKQALNWNDGRKNRKGTNVNKIISFFQTLKENLFTFTCATITLSYFNNETESLTFTAVIYLAVHWNSLLAMWNFIFYVVFWYVKMFWILKNIGT